MRHCAEGTGTFSRRDDQWCGGQPGLIVSGSGATITSQDGTSYLDCSMGLGSVSLGHGDDHLSTHVARIVREGTTFSRSVPEEEALAELVSRAIPGCQLLRFLGSGSDATEAAIRLARAHTGRDRIVTMGYHGWHDSLINRTSFHVRHHGVPSCLLDLVDRAPASMDALELITDRTAAVILEPMPATKPTLH